jgi:hypothetical protein
VRAVADPIGELIRGNFQQLAWWLFPLPCP